ncbi:MAG TPA: cytochrome b/b6 domain-containing protein [Sphingomonas sp.]|nr:cytochrome b/b6 domain-containing protein [Sphingomonas sp.]
MASIPADESPAAEDARPLVYRQRLVTRIWHWVNALAVIVMLMSGLMIFNAHPMLYWGQHGANHDWAWLAIGAGHVRIGSLVLPTFGLLGVKQGMGFPLAFPGWMTIPSHYDLAGAREWHFAFAWLLVAPGLIYWVWSFGNRHIQRDLAPSRDELRPHSLWRDIKDHARLRFHGGEQARRYNILQKLSYLAVLFVLLPLLVLTGLTMSPQIDAAWPWLLGLFGGRPSARSIHFICAMLIGLFIVIHILMVLLAGPVNELRSMITGWYRLPPEREEEA